MSILTDKRIGLHPHKRKETDEVNANQWISTPKQHRFIELWLLPSSKSFGNAYQSAVRAGFSSHYAKIISASHTNLKWVREAKRNLTNLQPDHIILQLQLIASTGSDSNRLSALDKLAKIHGLYRNRPAPETKVQFINSVPRPANEKVVLK